MIDLSPRWKVRCPCISRSNRIEILDRVGVGFSLVRLQFSDEKSSDWIRPAGTKSSRIRRVLIKKSTNLHRYLNKDSMDRRNIALWVYISQQRRGGAYGTYEKYAYRRALEIVGSVLGSPRPTPASHPTTDATTTTPTDESVYECADRTVPIPVSALNYH